MKLSHIAEAGLNQQMYGQRCHPHMAPVDIVDPDDPHPRVLKELSSVIALALCGIFRTPLQCGDTVPSDWKQAYGYVTITYKKESRPVSLTSICSDIIEHMLVSNIVRHFESLHILIDS